MLAGGPSPLPSQGASSTLLHLHTAAVRSPSWPSTAAFVVILAVLTSDGFLWPPEVSHQLGSRGEERALRLCFGEVLDCCVFGSFFCVCVFVFFFFLVISSCLLSATASLGLTSDTWTLEGGGSAPRLHSWRQRRSLSPAVTLPATAVVLPGRVANKARCLSWPPARHHSQPRRMETHAHSSVFSERQPPKADFWDPMWRVSRCWGSCAASASKSGVARSTRRSTLLSILRQLLPHDSIFALVMALVLSELPTPSPLRFPPSRQPWLISPCLTAPGNEHPTPPIPEECPSRRGGQAYPSTLGKSIQIKPRERIKEP